MGPTWGPSGADMTQVGSMNFAIWVSRRWSWSMFEWIHHTQNHHTYGHQPDEPYGFSGGLQRYLSLLYYIWISVKLLEIKVLLLQKIMREISWPCPYSNSCLLGTEALKIEWQSTATELASPRRKWYGKKYIYKTRFASCNCKRNHKCSSKMFAYAA